MTAEGRSEATCSRAGCGAPAAHRIEWRNPRIHAADRSKVWLACEEHADYLRVFLESRAFPVSVLPLETGVGGTVTA